MSASPSKRQRVASPSSPINKPVTVTISTKSTRILRGNSLVLNCTVHGETTPSAVLWTRSNGGPEENIQLTPDKHSGGTVDDPSLTVHNVTAEDSGTYVCKLMFDNDEVSSNSLTIHVEPVTVTISTKSTKILRGNSLVLHYTVNGETTPSAVLWTRSNGGPEENIQLTPDKHSGGTVDDPSLTVHNVTAEDSGTYVCKLMFDNDEVSSNSLTIHVEVIIDEELNFQKIQKLCFKPGTEALRLFLHRHIPESSLESHLNKWRRQLHPSSTNKWRCDPTQFATLFPAAPGKVCSSKFDISLLYKLIRNTLPNSHTYGWGQQLANLGSTDFDDIERIRHYRNILAHNTKKAFSETDWSCLSGAVIRLSNNALLSDVKELEKQTSNLIPEDVRQRILANWKIEDKVFCSDTRAYTAVINTVKSGKITVILGGPGTGKAATAHHIALEYESKGWQVIPVISLEHVVNHGNPSAKQVFVIDRLFGVYTPEMSVYNTFQRCRENIEMGQGRDFKLLLTSRKSVFNEVMGKYDGFSVVDLDSNNIALDAKEKKLILRNHCKAKNIPKEVYKHLFLTTDIMFPFLCFQFVNNKNYLECGERFFTNPHECITDELDRLKDHNPVQYAVLVLCLLSNNKLKPMIEVSKQLKIDVINRCCDTIGITDKALTKALDHLTGVYITHTVDSFKFKDKVMQEIVCNHFGKNNFEMILKYVYSDDRGVALCVECWKGHLDHVRDLVDLGADVNFIINHYTESTHKEILCDEYTQEVEGVLEKEIARYSFFEEKGNLYNIGKQSPLYNAASQGHAEIVKFLLEKSANVHFVDYSLGSVLYEAVRPIKPNDQAEQKRRLQITEYLLNKNADTNICTLDGESPLFIAAKCCQKQLIHLLVSHGADCSVRNDKGETPIINALLYNRPDIVQILVKAENKRNMNEKPGNIRLFNSIVTLRQTSIAFDGFSRGVCISDGEIIQIYDDNVFHTALEQLAKLGFDINRCNKFGETQLLAWCKSSLRRNMLFSDIQEINVFHWFVKNGANIYYRNDQTNDVDGYYLFEPEIWHNMSEIWHNMSNPSVYGMICIRSALEFFEIWNCSDTAWRKCDIKGFTKHFRRNSI